MGLLDRARGLRESITPKRGLLARAAAAAEAPQAPESSQAVAAPSESVASGRPSRKGGLLQRASSFLRQAGEGVSGRPARTEDVAAAGSAQASESAARKPSKPMGLLKRALGLKGGPGGAEDTAPLVTAPQRQAEVRSPDVTHREALHAEPQRNSHAAGLPDLDEARAVPLILDEPILDLSTVEQQPDQPTAVAAAPDRDVNDSHRDEASHVDMVGPDFEEQGAAALESAPAPAPAADETLLTDDLADDLPAFPDWENEALAEAEKSFDTGTSSTPESQAFLFDSDSDHHTLPAEAHIGSQKKIDNYMALFDVSKELSRIHELDALWDAVLFGVIGQVGAESACIFATASRTEGDWILYPQAFSGFEPPDGWALKPGDEIYDILSRESGVRYAAEFLRSSPISPLERNILETTAARVLIPLRFENRLYGIMIVGPALSGDDYTSDDLEFLSLMSEISVAGAERVLSRLEYEKDTEDLRRKSEAGSRIFALLREAGSIKDMDSVYDLVGRHLSEQLAVESYSVVLLSPSSQEYKIFGGNQVSPASVEKFRVSGTSRLIGRIANLTRVYDLENFREEGEITRCYTNDDLGLMHHYWILPLVNVNWLVGFITIHRTREPWTEFHREMAVAFAEAMAPVVGNCMILGERESLFRDPFSPLEDRLRLEIKRASDFQTMVALVEIRVKNVKRLLSLNPPEQMAEFFAEQSKGIGSFLFETDFMARIGQGRYALILPGRGQEEADIFVKKLKAEFRRMRLLRDSPVEAQYTHNIVTYPTDAQEAGKMLALLE